MTDAITICNHLWNNSKTLTEWSGETSPDPNSDLIWKAGHPEQVKDLRASAHLLDVPVRVVSDHRSKSVILPVGMFKIDVWDDETIYVFTRNNWHDVKAVVIASCPIGIPYSEVHREMSEAGLVAEKARAFDYMSRSSASDLSGFETDAWFSNWCSDSILRDAGKIWRCGTTASCYYEGMDCVPDEAFQRYEKGCSMFAAPVNGKIGLLWLIEVVRGSVMEHVAERRLSAMP